MLFVAVFSVAAAAAAACVVVVVVVVVVAVAVVGFMRSSARTAPPGWASHAFSASCGLGGRGQRPGQDVAGDVVVYHDPCGPLRNMHGLQQVSREG